MKNDLTNTDSRRIQELLTRLSMNGIIVKLTDDKLIAQYEKGKTVDNEILRELKAMKTGLMHYLRSRSSGHVFTIAAKAKAFMKDDSGREYFKVTPVQEYWINENWDRAMKEKHPYHGSAFLAFDILGDLDVNIFSRALNNLVSRHESLRTTFHLKTNEYLLRVEDNEHYVFEFRDATKADDSKQFVEFANHFRFDLKNGPLFLVRLLKQKPGIYVLSVKMHHIIFDNWSVDVMMRDLLNLYKNEFLKIEHETPALAYQYKDYLSASYSLLQNNYDIDRHFWEQRFPNLPNDLSIKYSSNTLTDLSEKICHSVGVQFPDEIDTNLRRLAKENSASVFVILQATLAGFLACADHQKDIVFGTNIFGRDWEQCDDQIGCYATTVLIRSQFDPRNSFCDVIKQVHKANKECSAHTAYPLTSHLENLLKGHRPMVGTFWKVNVQYTDTENTFVRQNSASIASQLGIKVSWKDMVKNPHIAIDLNFRFSTSAGKLYCKLDYDSSTYTETKIHLLLSDYLDLIEKITSDPVLPVASAYEQIIKISNG